MGRSYLQKPAGTFSLHPVLGMTALLREALTGREWQIQSSNINADLIIGTSLLVHRNTFDAALALKCLKNENGPFLFF